MYEEGYKCYFSENKIWLVDNVPAKYIKFKSLTDMEHENKQSSIKITLLGIGGAGLNTVSRLHDKLTDIHTVAICTDELSLSKSQAKTHLLIGKQTANGRGAGGNPKTGEKAARENEAAIRDIIKDTDVVFLTAGLAGGTGAGACYVASQIAKNMGIITIAFFIMPFGFEGPDKELIARQAAKKISGIIDAYLPIENEKLIMVCSKNTLMTTAYELIDRNIENFINTISDIINTDKRKTLELLFKKTGKLFFGSGQSSRKEGPLTALTRALNNPLIDSSIEDTTNIILSVRGKKILPGDVNNIFNGIKEVNENAAIIHSVNVYENSDYIVSIIAAQKTQNSKNA